MVLHVRMELQPHIDMLHVLLQAERVHLADPHAMVLDLGVAFLNAAGVLDADRYLRSLQQQITQSKPTDESQRGNGDSPDPTGPAA